MRSVPGTLRRLPARVQRAGVPLLALSLAGVVAVAIIGGLLLLHLRNARIEHAEREAERQATFAALTVVAPRLTPAVLRGDPRALAELDRAVRAQLLRD